MKSAKFAIFILTHFCLFCFTIDRTKSGGPSVTAENSGSPYPELRPSSDSGSKNTSAKIRVNTSDGEIEGLLYTSGKHLKAFIFLGVPYAEPPIGALRFSKPVNKRPWDGPLLCHDFKPSCTQSRLFDFGVKLEQSEDCLYLNVFVSENCLKNETGHNQKCPVLYWVHGGANEFGSPVTFSKDGLIDNFVSKDIVAVTIAHRLGILGFWSTGTEEAIGNWALEDITIGAKWIQDEIGNFGGDKDKVTIMGYSSSSALVTVLTTSKKTDGLFSQAGIMSGTGHRGFLLVNDLTNYWLLVNVVGCGSAMSIKETVDCMRKVPIQKLVDEFNEIRGFDSQSLDLPLNVTMPRNDGPDGFFPKPIEIMIAERRPLVVITGTNKNEDGLNKLKYINATSKTTADLCKSIVYDTGYVKKRAIKEACIEKYVKNVNFSEFSGSKFKFWTEKTVQVNEDFEYFSLCYKEAQTIMEAGGRSYLYSFDHAKAGLEDIATFHALDAFYLINSDSAWWDMKDREMHNRYVSLFSNFIKFGNPTPEPLDGVIWEPLRNGTDFNYLSINVPISMKMGYHRTGVQFWNDVVPKIELNSPGAILPKIFSQSKSSPVNEYFDEIDYNSGQATVARSALTLMAYVFVAMIFTVLFLVIVAVLITEFCINHRLSYERLN